MYLHLGHFNPPCVVFCPSKLYQSDGITSFTTLNRVRKFFCYLNNFGFRENIENIK